MSFLDELHQQFFLVLYPIFLANGRPSPEKRTSLCEHFPPFLPKFRSDFLKAEYFSPLLSKVLEGKHLATDLLPFEGYFLVIEFSHCFLTEKLVHL